MPKNSIGQFLSALRRASGLTQQEVADRLNVSNKAVSRWERDECAPDLSLIPALAEMFGVTCDELLRGERSSPRDFAGEENSEKPKAKADRQVKALLRSRVRKYHNLTLLSVGLMVGGLLSALVADLAFSEGLIAFALAAAFAAASEICQICFARNAVLPTDEETGDYAEPMGKATTSAVKTAVGVTFFNLLSIAFCLPPAVVVDGANFGLTFPGWLKYGLLFSFLAFLLFGLVYLLAVRKILIRSGLLIYNKAEKQALERQRSLLRKTATISVGAALVIGVGIFLLNCLPADSFAKRKVFPSPAEFKEFVERECDERRDDLSYEILIGEEGIEEAPYKEYGEILNSRGEAVCSYYYNPHFYYSIEFSHTSEDGAPITVITREGIRDAVELKSGLESGLYLLLLLDFVLAAGVYIYKGRKRMAAARA